jgi:hypothetical protein
MWYGLWYDVWYTCMFNRNWHPAAAVQYTFTHNKQNTENGTYITRQKLNIHKNKKLTMPYICLCMRLFQWCWKDMRQSYCSSNIIIQHTQALDHKLFPTKQLALRGIRVHGHINNYIRECHYMGLIQTDWFK